MYVYNAATRPKTKDQDQEEEQEEEEEDQEEEEKRSKEYDLCFSTRKYCRDPPSLYTQ